MNIIMYESDILVLCIEMLFYECIFVFYRIFSNPFTATNRIKQRQLPAAAADQLVNSAKPNSKLINCKFRHSY